MAICYLVDITVGQRSDVTFVNDLLKPTTQIRRFDPSTSGHRISVSQVGEEIVPLFYPVCNFEKSKILSVQYMQTLSFDVNTLCRTANKDD